MKSHCMAFGLYGVVPFDTHFILLKLLLLLLKCAAIFHAFRLVLDAYDYSLESVRIFILKIWSPKSFFSHILD